MYALALPQHLRMLRPCAPPRAPQRVAPPRPLAGARVAQHGGPPDGDGDDEDVAGPVNMHDAAWEWLATIPFGDILLCGWPSVEVPHQAANLFRPSAPWLPYGGQCPPLSPPPAPSCSYFSPVSSSALFSRGSVGCRG
jgi:hypothetical protein